MNQNMPQYIIKLVQHVMVNFNGQIITMSNGTMIYIHWESFCECLPTCLPVPGAYCLCICDNLEIDCVHTKVVL